MKTIAFFILVLIDSLLVGLMLGYRVAKWLNYSDSEGASGYWAAIFFTPLFTLVVMAFSIFIYLRLKRRDEWLIRTNYGLLAFFVVLLILLV